MSGGGVMQHLMAEQSYRPQTKRNTEVTRDSSRGNSPLTKAKNHPTNYPRTHTPPRRAMSDESPSVESPPHPYLNSSSRSAESSGLHFSSTNFSTPHPPSRTALIGGGSGNLISRLRKEFLNKPSPTQIRHKTAPQRNPGDNIEQFRDCGNASVTPTQPNLLSRGNFPSPSPSKHQLDHPKSNSAGEEFLYTDRKAKLTTSKLGRRRGKTPTSVIRSRSLHYADENQTPHVIVQRRPATDLGLGSEPFTTIGTPRKRSDASTVSSSSITSDKPGSHGSSTGDGYFQIAVNEEANKPTDLPQYTPNASSLSDIRNTQFQHINHLSNMVMTPSGMGGLPQPAMTQSNPHGPYYATVPTNPIGHHSNQQRHSPPPPSHQPRAQTGTPVRGPPPPYPQGSGMSEETHPQRPNSLPLSGQISRKKMEYGGTTHVGGLTSPAIATSAQITGFNYPMSAGTPVNGTAFYTFPQEGPAPTTTANGSNNIALQGYAVTPQQPSQGQFKRSGSSNGFQQLVASSQSQISDTTLASNATTNNPVTSYQQPRYEPVRQPQHMTPQKQHSTSPTYSQQGQEFQPTPGYPQVGAGTSSGFSLGKSDSNASTSSAGSRIARRTKRNSKNFSNTSGSSSSTGNSRPNSSADSLERILSEYETMRSQLLTAEKKLKKFQNVEKELLRVSKDYENLQASAMKRENMELELRDQLDATNRRTQQENEILRERISTLAELVETLQSSNKDAQTSSGEIMTYKVKVKELEAKKRVLDEQLEEAQDRISDQKEDITLLSSSLGRMQTQVASLKEKLLEKRRSEQYVEDLSPLLDKLSRTVEMRLQAESELSDIVGISQRPSTSSNDEGISEMDSIENASHTHTQSLSTQSSSSTIARDEQLIRMQAQVLKWQHMYVQTALLRELSSGEVDGANSAVPLYTMLYNHRHAASDPSFDKNMLLDLPVWHSTGLKSLYRRDAEIRREHKHAESKKRAQNQRRDRTTSEHARSSPRTHRRDMPSPLKGQTSAVTGESTNSDKKAGSDSGDCSSDKGCRKKTTKQDSTGYTEVQGSNEVDSPSEGYHSQQSSGSPTPSSERSSVHFPEGDSRVSAALAPLQDTSCTNPTHTNVATSRQPSATSTNTGLYVVNV